MSERKKGSTGVSLLFRLTDSSTGAAKSGIDVTTLKLQYERPGEAVSTATSLTLLAALTTAHTDYGAKECDATNSKGVYRVDCPDAGFATGADEVTWTVTGPGIEPSTRLIDLTAFDSRDVNGNLQGLNGTTAPTAGALITSGTGTAQLTVSSGIASSDAKKINGVSTSPVTTVNANLGTTQPVNFTGTGTTAYIKSGLWGILGTALTETVAGYLAAAFKKLFNVASPTLTAAGVDQTGDSYVRIGATGTGLTSLAPASTALSTANWTNARAGFLDNINVGGPVASQSDVDAINLSATKHLILVTVPQYEPGETYTIEMRTFNAADGSAVNASPTPTLTATGNVSGDLSANLSTASTPATGVYRWTYTPGSSPTSEQIRFDGSATISAATFTISAYSQTIGAAAASFTSTDQSHLTSIFNKLPAGDIADEAIVLAAIGAPMQAGNVTLAASQPNYAPAKAGDKMDLVDAPNSTAITAIQSGLSKPATAQTISSNSDITAIKAKTDNLPASPAAVGSAMTLTTAERTAISNALLDLADAVETGITLRQSHRAQLAALCGKLVTAGANPEVYQNPAGTADRLTVANDSSGNRSAVTLTL